MATVRFYQMQSSAFGDITSSYTLVGVPISNTLRNITFQNLTDEQVDVSFDGSTRNLTFPPMSFAVFDICANLVQNQTNLIIGKGTKIYVKYTSGAPSSGEFVYTGFYARGE